MCNCHMQHPMSPPLPHRACCHTIYAHASQLVPPGAPQNVDASPGNAQVALTWDPPSATGGAPLLSCTATLSPCTSTPGPCVACVACVATPPSLGGCVSQGLVNGVGYVFVVQCDNPVGPGPPSPPTDVTYPVASNAPPGTPLGPYATALHGYVWSRGVCVTADVC